MVEQAPWTRTTLAAAAAAIFYQALRVASGNYSPVAFAGLVITCIMLLFACFGPPLRRLEDLREKPVLAILAAGLALQFAELIGMALRHHRGSSFAHIFFLTGLVACAGMTIAVATSRARLRNAWFCALVAMHFLLGVAYLRIAEVPMIDVILVQRDSAAALLSGHNPYAITYPNLYGDEALFYYGSEIKVVNGRVQEGFCYPPLVLYLCLPSYLLTGDIRYSHLAAFVLSGLLLGFAGRGMVSKLAALLFLYSPRAFHLVQSAWTEPFIMLFFGLALFQASRSRVPTVALGLLMAAKQYVVLAVPVGIWLLLRHRSLKSYTELMLKAGGVGLAVSLPLILWSIPAFYHSAIETILMKGPFRPDSLSFSAWLVRHGFHQLPSWVALLAVGIAAWFLIRKLRPSPASFALSISLLFLIFFSLSRQAVLNYYYMVAICMCGAVAAAKVEPEVEALRVRELERETARVE